MEEVENQRYNASRGGDSRNRISKARNKQQSRSKVNLKLLSGRTRLPDIVAKLKTLLT